MKFGLTRQERLRSESTIALLFGRSSSYLVSGGFRLAWVMQPDKPGSCAMLAISSKKKMKRATDRNRRKRLLRELYRLNKHPLLEFLSVNHTGLALSIAYVGKDELQFHAHTEPFQKSIHKLIHELEKAHSAPLPPAH